ncbi:MAG: peptide ABC transporter substrate-binding protein [Cyanobacteria bacterium QS_8_64_29]|nr:MAG: peptide ABC transporter substrate-binding protein [Cyanobacteria bacterium QS_8_64_29]
MPVLTVPRTWRRWGQYLAAFLLCAMLAVSCSGGEQAPDGGGSSEPDRITVGTTLDPSTLDPASTYEVAALNLPIYNLGETLYAYDPETAELKPQLATAMPQVSDDGLRYTIPLREGGTFHDGTPFNAEAMAFSLRRFMENGGKPSFLLDEFVESVSATGEFELTIRLQNPFVALPSLLAFTGTCAVSPQAYEIGEGKFEPKTFVGTGPYRLAEFSSDSLTLDIFEDYWGDPPANDGVDIQIYKDKPANLFNAFRSGSVDVAYLSLTPQQTQTLRQGAEANKWQAMRTPGVTVSYMALNLQQDPLGDQALRQAIAASLDREQLVERVLNGQGKPLYSLVPTTFEAHEPAFKQAYGQANLDLARQKLQEASYSSDNPATIPMWYPSGSKTRSVLAQTLRAFAQQKLDGAIRFQPQSVESARFFDEIGQGSYPATLVDWYPDFLDADNYLEPFLACQQGSPQGGCQQGGAQSQGSFYYSERINQLIERERREREPQARQRLFRQIQQQLAEDVPYIPLWQSQDSIFAQSGVAGIRLNPRQALPLWSIHRQSASAS